jgi:hypothetical protein
MGTGITINAGAGDYVSLRGLIIEGSGSGSYGIQFNSGKTLIIENCIIRNMRQIGIDFEPNTESLLTVSSSVVTRAGLIGIGVGPSGSNAITAVVHRVEWYYTGQALKVDTRFGTGMVRASVSESIAAGNSGGFGVRSYAPHGPATLLLSRSVAASNFLGINAEGDRATLRVTQSIVTGNEYGWALGNNGTVLSAGDNTFEGNTNTASEVPPPRYALK